MYIHLSICPFTYPFLFISIHYYICFFRLKEDDEVHTHKQSLLPNKANPVYISDTIIMTNRQFESVHSVWKFREDDKTS